MFSKCSTFDVEIPDPMCETKRGDRMHSSGIDIASKLYVRNPCFFFHTWDTNDMHSILFVIIIYIYVYIYIYV